MAKAKAEKAKKAGKTDKKKTKPATARGKTAKTAAKAKAAPAEDAPRPLRLGERPWPGRQVEDQFGSKSKLVATVKKLISDELLEDRLGEEKGLERVSNKKLLRLHAIGTKVKAEFGGREGLIDAIVAVEKRVKDKGYRTRLERYPTPRLLDIVKAARRRAKRA